MERGRKKSAGLTDEEGNGCPTLSWQFAKTDIVTALRIRDRELPGWIVDFG
jgi:hypothetical protein